MKRRNAFTKEVLPSISSRDSHTRTQCAKLWLIPLGMAEELRS